MSEIISVGEEYMTLLYVVLSYYVATIILFSRSAFMTDALFRACRVLLNSMKMATE